MLFLKQYHPNHVREIEKLEIIGKRNPRRKFRHAALRQSLTLLLL